MKTLTSVVIFVVTFAILAERVSGPGLDDPPSGGDERDYEALAFNLWKGRGFGFAWGDPEWLAPYLSASPSADATDRQSGYYPTAYRPPVFPMLWALTYEVTGRNFGAIRFVNAGLMAGAVTCAAAIAIQFGGLAAAPVTAALLLWSPDITIFARERLTEPLAAFLVSLLVWLWVAGSTRAPSARTALVSGAVLGLLILSRSIFVLWLPVAMLMPAKPPATGGIGRGAARALCLMACLMVVTPWWTRNIVVTGAFLPTGTQGPINLPAAFSQRALDNEGRWRSNPGDGAEEIEAAGVDGFSIEYEVRLAQHRSTLTRAWMWDHPREVVQLMGLHVWQEFRARHGRTDLTLLFSAALVALVYFRRHPGTPTVALILAAMLLSIALTWGFNGRYMLPVHPPMFAVVGAMAVSLAMRLAPPLRRLLPARDVRP